MLKGNTVRVQTDKWNTITDTPISGQTGTTATSVNEWAEVYIYIYIYIYIHTYVENERKERALNKRR